MRYVGRGEAYCQPSIAHTEGDDNIHVISFRKATRYETELLFSQIKDELPPAPKPRRQRRSRDRRRPGGRPETHRKEHRPTRPKGRRTQGASVTSHRYGCAEVV